MTTHPIRRLALYMFYNPQGVVPEYVLFKLEKLREHVTRTVVVVNGVLTPESRDALEKVADLVHVRENVGFDVWAYREGLIDVVGWDEVGTYDEVILANYTFYAPIFPFSEMFEEMASRSVDFWGITAFVGPVPNFFTGEGVLPTHIQSHFIAVRRPMLQSAEFRTYWEDLPPIRSYVDSVLKHECHFTGHFERLGHTWSVYSDPQKYPVPTVSYDALDLILEDRCPILKRKPFFNDPLSVDLADVHLHRAIELIEETSDYDTSLIWKDMTRVAKSRDLYTNATLLEVPAETGPVRPVRKGIRIAVLAHVYYPEMITELLGYAKNIPVPFDLVVTTSSEEKKKEIIQRVGKAPGLTLKEVRVIENRGRDVAALLVGLRDVVRDGGYDLICRLHSKASPQDSFGMSRHFKEHLFENLLASPAYVARLIEIFETEPCAGVVFPPTVQIGYPTLGRAWFNNRPGAEEWAKKLGIRVPFDDFTPMCAHGSMYWFRPQALKPLFDYPFRWTDFPPEPHYADGDLPHVLERLVVYAAHQAGYYGKCVFTPSNAAENYVKLEWKYRRELAEAAAQRPPPATFPMQQLKEFAIDRLSASPAFLGAVRTGFKATRRLYRMAAKREGQAED